MKPSTVKVSRAMQEIGRITDRAIQNVAGERIAFALVVFTPERASYISNAPRPQASKALRELLDGWDKGMPDVAAHEVQ